MTKYNKFLMALGTALVEAVALWQDAPPWLVALVGFIGAGLVYRVPNKT